MAYRVEYDCRLKGERQKESWGIRRVAITCLMYAVFVISVCFFWDEGKTLLMQLLLPADAAVTWRSLGALSEDLRQGIPVSFALREFCNEILQSCY